MLRQLTTVLKGRIRTRDEKSVEVVFPACDISFPSYQDQAFYRNQMNPSIYPPESTSFKKLLCRLDDDPSLTNKMAAKERTNRNTNHGLTSS